MEHTHYVAQKFNEDGTLDTGMYSHSEAYATPQLAAEQAFAWAAKQGNLQRWAIVEVTTTFAPTAGGIEPHVLARTILAIQTPGSHVHPKARAERELEIQREIAAAREHAAQAELRAEQIRSAVQRRQIERDT